MTAQTLHASALVDRADAARGRIGGGVFWWMAAMCEAAAALPLRGWLAARR
jgi:hypothetical protein